MVWVNAVAAVFNFFFASCDFFFSFTSLARLCLWTTKFVLFVLVLGFYISVTLMCDFCPWFEFSTSTYICCICVVVSIHYLLYHCIFQFKTAKEMYSFF